MIETQDLERLKVAVANVFATEADDPAQHDRMVKLGADVLDAIDAAATEQTDPRPFGVGKPVASREWAGLKGMVVRRIEANGELHTVGVQWPSWPSVELYSPSELVEL